MRSNRSNKPSDISTWQVPKKRREDKYASNASIDSLFDSYDNGSSYRNSINRPMPVINSLPKFSSKYNVEIFSTFHGATVPSPYRNDSLPKSTRINTRSIPNPTPRKTSRRVDQSGSDFGFTFPRRGISSNWTDRGISQRSSAGDYIPSYGEHLDQSSPHEKPIIKVHSNNQLSKWYPDENERAREKIGFKEQDFQLRPQKVRNQSTGNIILFGCGFFLLLVVAAVVVYFCFPSVLGKPGQDFKVLVGNITNH